jgi:hypothetical protein
LLRGLNFFIYRFLIEKVYFVLFGVLKVPVDCAGEEEEGWDHDCYDFEDF